MKNIRGPLKENQNRISFLLNIVDSLYEKKYKIDNFRSVLQNLIGLLDLKFAVFIKGDLGYYIDNEKFFYISKKIKLEKYKAFLKKLLKHEGMVVINNCSKEYRVFENLGGDYINYSFFFLKLTKDMYILGSREVPFSQREITLLSKVKTFIKKSIEQDIKEDNLLEKAYTDTLTGLYNRRFFEKVIPMELEKAKRYKYPVSVIFMDIDNFKLLNDLEGHLAGDIFLKMFGNLIKDVIRKSDIPIRIGGDEFLLFLPFTRKKDAENLAYKIRKILMDSKDLLCEGRRCDYIDISFGILEVDKDNTPETILSKADFLMYQAKKFKKEKS